MNKKIVSISCTLFFILIGTYFVSLYGCVDNAFPYSVYLEYTSWETEYSEEEHIERIESTVKEKYGDRREQSGNYKIYELVVKIMYSFDEIPEYFVIDLMYAKVNSFGEWLIEDEDYGLHKKNVTTWGYIMGDKYYYFGWLENFESVYKRLNVMNEKLYFGRDLDAFDWTNMDIFAYENDGVMYSIKNPYGGYLLAEIEQLKVEILDNQTRLKYIERNFPAYNTKQYGLIRLRLDPL